MARKNSPYFDDFNTMVSYSVQAAEKLHEVLSNFDPESLSEASVSMHEIEHTEDEIKHELMRRLVKEFVPPIDREDIIYISNELDDVTDKIDDILIRMYMYNIRTLRPEAMRFADVIVRCCKALQIAMAEFPNFQKSTTLMEAIIQVNTMEEEGDALYIEAVRNLYRSDESDRDVAAWSELFDRLEDCCDACEHVADAMETIAMKNS